MYKQKNPGFIICTGIIIAIGRFLLGLNDPSNNTLLVMAIVNYVAFGFVILFLYNDLERRCLEKITKAGTDTNTKHNRRLVTKIVSLVLLVIYLIFGGYYLIKLKSNSLNDVISIVALSISIAANDLVEKYSDTYFNFIVWVTTKKM